MTDVLHRIHRDHGAAHSVSSPWNSLVMRESDFPTRLTNAQLQSLTS